MAAENFNISISNIDQLITALNNYPDTSKKYFSRAINAALAYISQSGARDEIMQFKAPRNMRSGMLQQSFDLGLRQATESNLSGSIGPTVEYAPYVENGTAAHIIEIVNKKCLANVKTGQIFGTRVNHPGTQPNPFMERIIAAAKPDIEKTFSQALDLVTATLKV